MEDQIPEIVWEDELGPDDLEELYERKESSGQWCSSLTSLRFLLTIPLDQVVTREIQSVCEVYNADYSRLHRIIYGRTLPEAVEKTNGGDFEPMPLAAALVLRKYTPIAEAFRLLDRVDTLDVFAVTTESEYCTLESLNYRGLRIEEILEETRQYLTDQGFLVSHDGEVTLPSAGGRPAKLITEIIWNLYKYLSERGGIHGKSAPLIRSIEMLFQPSIQLRPRQVEAVVDSSLLKKESRKGD